MEVEVEEDSVTGEGSEEAEEEGDSEEEEVEDSGPQRVEDFGAVGVAEEPREGEEAEEEEAVAEEALEPERKSWLSHTDTKECLSQEGRRMPW